MAIGTMVYCMGDETSITCKEPTKSRLERLGHKGETWDELLNRVADMAEAYKNTKHWEKQ